MFTSVGYLALLAAICVLWAYRKYTRLPLPPGPPRVPLIGNLHQIPSTNPWRTYQKWHDQYGPIISVKTGLGTTIILGSHKVARDLLEKRNSIYSSRPHLRVLGDFIYGGYQTALLPYGSRWRLHHRIHAEFVNIRTSLRYRDLQGLETKLVLKQMLDSNNFAAAFQRYSSSLLFALTYGKRMLSGDEAEIRDIGKIMELVLEEASRNSVAEAFPILNALPDFLARWKHPARQVFEKQAQLLAKHMGEALEGPLWNWCKQGQKLKVAEILDQTEFSFILGNLYEASHTTPMVLEVFVMASVLHQDAVAKAQDELDDVVGQDRLPNPGDQPTLPFVNAFIQEVLRWRPVTPGGMPHASIQEDEYMGFRIPLGATVVANHWSLDLDSDVFEDPYQFKPERWIENPNLPSSAFGFGRRTCPGKHIARYSLFSIIATFLWAFHIEHAYENGKKLEIDSLAFTQGADSRPMPFKASFRPRSLRHREIIEQQYAASEKDFGLIMNSIGSSFT